MLEGCLDCPLSRSCCIYEWKCLLLLTCRATFHIVLLSALMYTCVHGAGDPFALANLALVNE
jgi:hypothetical protein